MAVKTGKIDWSDRLNPVLVKEIRQSFHNYGVLTVMGVLLAAQLVLLVVMQYQVSRNPEAFSGTGAVMFGFVVTGMALAALLIGALGTLLRFTAERRSRELDFSFLTTLSPNRIVWGKLAGAMVMTVFIFALCLPFIVISYFLRGIGMEQMLFVVLTLFPMVCVASQLAILIGSAGQRWLVSVFVLLAFFGSWPCVIFMILMIDSVFSGNKSLPGIMLLWYGCSGMLLGLLYALSVAAIGARRSNRMLPVRLSLIGIFLLSPLVGLGVGLIGNVPRLGVTTLLFMSGFGSAAAALCATIAAFERFDPGKRVMRKCPKNRFGKFWFLLVSSGARAGIGLAVLLTVLSALVAAAVYKMDRGIGMNTFLWAASCCYFIFYANVALGAKKRLKQLPGWCWWAVTVIVFVAIPVLFGGTVSALSRVWQPYFFTTTPFCTAFGAQSHALVWIGPSLALLSSLPAAFSALSWRKRP